MSFTAEAGAGFDMQSLMAQEEELRGQMQMVERQLELLSTMRDEKHRARETLRAIESSEAGGDILFPIGGATFVRAKLGDNSTVLKGIGADYTIPRAIEVAIEELKQELETLDKDIERMNQTAGQLEARHQQLVQMAQSGMGGAPAQPPQA